MKDIEKWALIYCIPHIEKRYMQGKRYQTICLSLSGVELASKNRYFKYSRCVEETFHITQAGEEYLTKEKQI